MRVRRLPPLVTSCLVLLTLAGGAAHAQEWRLTGGPSFEPSVNAVPEWKNGETRTFNDGEGGVTSTLNARTFNGADVTSTQPRYGTHHMSYSWDSPPAVIRAGELLPFAVRWSIGQK